MSRGKRSVLVVEDERIVALDLRQTLDDLGYDVLGLASTADEAIAHAEKKLPDLILMDIRIKGERDGVEAAQILRERFGVPVIFLTAHGDDATLERVKKAEPYGYLMKPITAQELRTTIDVTLNRREMEVRLAERERWFATTLASIGDAVITVDMGGRVTFMNEAAERLTGVSASDAAGKLSQEVLQFERLPNREVRGPTPLDWSLREAKQVTVDEAMLVNLLTKEARTISDTTSPVLDGGRMLGAVMVFRDVTERRRARAQLELTDRLASLGTMAAGVAHEINNPLTVIAGTTAFATMELEKLRERWGEGLSDLDQCLGDIRSATDRIVHIVSDLHAFARRGPDEGEADLGEAIDWAVRSTTLELKNRARVVVEVAEGLPVVQASRIRLGQVLINLLINAAHAIEPGRADANEVRIIARPCEGGVEVFVRDTGCGMSPELQKRIFEPFFTTKGVGKGTGLGLAICKGIIGSVGGTIDVESAVGKGTTFTVRLPAATVRDARQTEPAPGPETSHSRILVVDDEELILRTITRILRSHDVATATTVEEAIARLENEHFDLVLCDLMMPLQTGRAFYKMVLQRFPRLAARFVFMSGGALTTELQRFLETTGRPCIQKPFDIDALERAIAEAAAA